MIKFDEVLPYGRQKISEIYSPRLVNMMLACCPQIESITKLISQKCNFPDDSVPNMIQKINEKGVLSHFEIFQSHTDYCFHHLQENYPGGLRITN